MLKLIRLIKAGWGRIRMARRFYPYGTLGLSVIDDRSALEKVSDKIDEVLSDLENRFKYKVKSVKPIWNTYWDICSGSWITSAADIRKIERDRGWVCMKPGDIKIEADNAYKAKKAKSQKATKEYLRKCAKEINQGRSFIKERNERIRSGKDNLGNVRTMN